jgi:hypothetical protein
MERRHNVAHPELYGWREAKPQRYQRPVVEEQQMVRESYSPRVSIDRQGTSYGSAHKQYKF